LLLQPMDNAIDFQKIAFFNPFKIRKQVLYINKIYCRQIRWKPYSGYDLPEELPGRAQVGERGKTKNGRARGRPQLPFLRSCLIIVIGQCSALGLFYGRRNQPQIGLTSKGFDLSFFQPS
jgi:hypothetical protein